MLMIWQLTTAPCVWLIFRGYHRAARAESPHESLFSRTTCILCKRKEKRLNVMTAIAVSYSHDPYLSRLKQKSGGRKNYCKPCRDRRVKCTMERPVCVRCLRKTRSQQCTWDDDAAKSSVCSSTTSVISRRASLATTPTEEADIPLVAKLLSAAAQQPVIGDFDEFSRDSGFEELLLSSTVNLASSRQLSMAPSTVFETVFHNHWLPDSSILAFPQIWSQTIAQCSQDMPILSSAVRAIGAMKIGEKAQACQEYSSCLRALVPKLQADNSTSFNAETCSTILMLLCFELLNGNQLQNLARHLQGLAVLLKQHVVFLTHGDAAQLSRFPVALARLVYRSFRNVDEIESGLQCRLPRLTVQEWKVLLPDEIFDTPESASYNAALNYINESCTLTVPGIVLDVEAITKLHLSMTTYIEQLLYLNQIEDEPLDEAELAMFSLTLEDAQGPGLLVKDAFGTFANDTTGILILVLGAKLNLELHMPWMASSSIITHSDTIVRLVQAKISTPNGKFGVRARTLPWCVYAMSVVLRAHLATDVVDARSVWAQLLLMRIYRVMITWSNHGRATWSSSFNGGRKTASSERRASHFLWHLGSVFRLLVSDHHQSFPANFSWWGCGIDCWKNELSAFRVHMASWVLRWVSTFGPPLFPLILDPTRRTFSVINCTVRNIRWSGQAMVIRSVSAWTISHW